MLDWINIPNCITCTYSYLGLFICSTLFTSIWAMSLAHPCDLNIMSDQATTGGILVSKHPVTVSFKKNEGTQIMVKFRYCASFSFILLLLFYFLFLLILPCHAALKILVSYFGCHHIGITSKFCKSLRI